jgi:hypothetical protein
VSTAALATVGSIACVTMTKCRMLKAELS